MVVFRTPWFVTIASQIRRLEALLNKASEQASGVREKFKLSPGTLIDNSWASQATPAQIKVIHNTPYTNLTNHTSLPLTLIPINIPQTTAKLASFFRSALRPLRSTIALPFAATAAAGTTFYSPSSTPALANNLSTATSVLQQTRNMHSKLVIIGSGPAGHTAAIYAARADLKPVMYEGFLALGIAAGGQLTTTDEVENFPGFAQIQGATLMDQMRAQSEGCGTEIISQTVGKVDLSERPFKFWLNPMGDDDNLEEETHTADSIIIATGAKARRLNLDGEDKYWGNGVSACAVCDGSLPIFREKPLVVIGGGDSAVEEGIYLTKKASKVTVLVRKDFLRASKANARRLTTNPKVEIRYNTQGVEIKGDEGPRGLMKSMVIKNNKTGETEEIPANGLFYAVGHDPATYLFKDQLKMDEDGYIITTPGTAETSIPGVFAAGDVQDKKYRQAVTSAGKFQSPE
jgi:thioredoxin reductase (NADPH)